MSKFPEILNFFRVRPEANYIVALIALVIAGYEIISQIFFPVPIDGDPNIIFIRNILFLGLVIIGLLAYSLIPKYRIDYDKYWEILPKINFAQGRLGTDGLCCFLTSKDKAVTLPRKTDQLLICAALTKEPEPGTDMEDIINENNIQIYTNGKRCINLELSYKIENDDLILDFKCGDYDNRPQACREYPLYTGKPCRLAQCCSTPCEQVNYFNWSAIFFYAFEQKKYPELEKYSVGIAQNLLNRYFLIPVPFSNSKSKNIFC